MTDADARIAELERLVAALQAGQASTHRRRRTNDEIRAAGGKPRKNGEGSVFPVTLPDGQTKWRATFTVGRDEKGRAKQVKGQGSTPEEAVRRRDEAYRRWLVKIGELPSSALQKVAPRPLEMTVAEFLTDWLTWKTARNESKHRISTNVANRYEGAIRNHILPAIGSIPIRLLTTEDIEELLFVTLPAKRKTRKNKQTGEMEELDEPLLGSSPLRSIRGILAMACEWGTTLTRPPILKENPMLGVTTIDKDEVDFRKLGKYLWLPGYLLSRFEGDVVAQARWILRIYGLRQGEQLGLRWSDFANLNNANKPTTLRIEKQLYNDEKQKILTLAPVKTKSSERTLPIDKRVTSILLAYAKVQDSWRKAYPDKWEANRRKHGEWASELVFTTREGAPIRHSVDNKDWHRIADAKPAPDVRGNQRLSLTEQFERDNFEFRPHMLRHLAVTYLMKAGMPIELVSAWVGHADSDTTRKIYTHLTSSALVDVGTALTDHVLSRVSAE